MSNFITSVNEIVGVDCAVRISRYPRDAVLVVNDYLQKAEESEETVRVYAVGGDGILFDCLNGMVKYPGHELASVPYGNANDFLRSFGEENVPLFRDIKKMSAAPTVNTDIFRCGENVAVANAAIGLESTSILETEKLARKLSKFPNLRKFIPQLYLIGAVIVLCNKKMRSQHYNITLDDKDYSGEYIDINIGNSYANGVKNIPNPYAVPNDGYLHAVFVKKMPLIKCLIRVSAFVNGEFEKYPNDFFYVKFKKLHATSEDNVRICVDGEAFITSDLTMEIYPNALKIAAPKGVKYRPYRKPQI
jgi:diacylglycerol kinase family enzyme